jgi:MFS family permease
VARSWCHSDRPADGCARRLPREPGAAERESLLKISDANQQWVITAYTLTFGGLLLLGGVLTEYLSWRWCLLVNAPIAMSAVLMAVPWVHESRAERDTRYDVAHSVPRWGS